jgi:hypothetical protein
MRFLASCRGINGTKKEYPYHEVFKNRGDILAWFNHKYREYSDLGYTRFEWLIFDYQDADVYYDGISCIKDASFIENILNLEPMSRFLKIRNGD